MVRQDRPIQLKSLEIPANSSQCIYQVSKDVFIEISLHGARFTDNFFDLLPGEQKKIAISSPEIKKAKKLPLTVKHIRDTYKPK